jgi:Flp pilus assembly pilin Flp
MTPRIRNGQSTLEYVIILAVVIAAIIGVAKVFKVDVGKAYNTVYNTTPGS